MPKAKFTAEEISDEELIVRIIRYMRSAPKGSRATRIIRLVSEDYPWIERSRILQCSRKAADMLLQQHSDV